MHTELSKEKLLKRGFCCGLKCKNCPYDPCHIKDNTIIKKQANNKISLATVYNTVHAFEKKGYLKQIPINSSEAYFDTNVTDHHHFYDLKEEKLIDLENSDVGPINILKKINGKKIKSVEVLVKLED